MFRGYTKKILLEDIMYDLFKMPRLFIGPIQHPKIKRRRSRWFNLNFIQTFVLRHRHEIVNVINLYETYFAPQQPAEYNGNGPPPTPVIHDRVLTMRKIKALYESNRVTSQHRREVTTNIIRTFKRIKP